MLIHQSRCPKMVHGFTMASPDLQTIGCVNQQARKLLGKLRGGLALRVRRPLAAAPRIGVTAVSGITTRHADTKSPRGA